MAVSQSQRLRRMAEKASRRKAVVAEKRRAEMSTIAGHEALELIEAARAPITTCVVAERLFADGMGSLVLGRTLPSGMVGSGVFLIDAWCLGVKEAFFRIMPRRAFDAQMDQLSQSQPAVDIDPSRARKLLHDAAAYAGSFGLPSDESFAKVEALFGDVALATETFSFGKDGKPFFVSGPNDTRARIRGILEALARSAGPDRFDYAIDTDALG